MKKWKQSSLLEPSQKSLFIRSDLKIFLSKERLITIRSRGTPLYRLLPGLRDSLFLDTGRLLLTIFDESISALLQSFSPEYEPKTAGLRGDGQPSKDQLWWRLRNFRAALLSHVKIMHEPVFLGTWLFGPEDKGMINSIKAKISFLCDMTSAMLCRFDSPALGEAHRNILCAIMKDLKEALHEQKGKASKTDGSGVADRIFFWTEKLRLYEKRFAADCVYLKSQACWEGGELFDAVFDAMFMDSQKHQKLLLAVKEMIRQ